MIATVALAEATTAPPTEKLTYSVYDAAVHPEKVKVPKVLVYWPFAAKVAFIAIGSTTGQPGGSELPVGPEKRP